MIEDRAALVVSLNGNNISVLHACSLSILGGHMDMAHCHDTSLFQIKGSFRSHDSDGRAAVYIAGFTNLNLHSQLNGICSRYLYLGSLADRSQNSYILDRAKLQTHDRDSFVGRELSAHEFFFLRQLISRSEQSLYVLLCQVNMSCGNADGNHEASAFAFTLINGVDNHLSDQFNIFRFQEHTCFPLYLMFHSVKFPLL